MFCLLEKNSYILVCITVDQYLTSDRITRNTSTLIETRDICTICMIITHTRRIRRTFINISTCTIHILKIKHKLIMIFCKSQLLYAYKITSFTIAKKTSDYINTVRTLKITITYISCTFINIY